MTTTNDTQEHTERFQHPAQTLDGAKRAAALLQAPGNPVAGEEIAYLDTGAGLVFTLSTDGTFSLAGLDRDGRPVLELTAEETHALWRFWLPIWPCGSRAS
jgi:hypothetical protein